MSISLLFNRLIPTSFLKRGLPALEEIERPAERREFAWVQGLLLLFSVILVYSNCLRGPFIYDDYSDVMGNPSIRHIWPMKDVFYQEGSGFFTRPITNLTFAANYAYGRLNPFSYHVVNVAIHALGTVTLFGVMRRALMLPDLVGKFGRYTAVLSMSVAAIWGLHPLQTESVSYITQRYESLMGLFVLQSIYAFLRSMHDPQSKVWDVWACFAFLLALGSKEIAVSLPIILLAFDRAFVTGSIREALVRRRWLYLGLVLAWVIFAYVQLHAAKRTFAGFELDTPWWKYALNQPRVIVHYLRLSVWPAGLNFDYLWRPVKSWILLVPGLVVVTAGLAYTGWGLVKNRKAAILPLFFFLILAPTSSVMPILDLAVEHRMYLPLLSVVVAGVLMVFHGVKAGLASGYVSRATVRVCLILLLSVSVSALGGATYIRNEDYRNTIDLWLDAVQKGPENPRAHHNYAFNLAGAGYMDEAVRHYQIAIEQSPKTPLFRCNYGVLLGQLGRYEESLEHLRLALQLEPTNYKNYLNLGTTLLLKGSVDNALVCYEEASRVDPKAATPYYGQASVAQVKGDTAKAMALIQKAITLSPENGLFPYKLGAIQLKLGQGDQARKSFDAALRLSENKANMIAEIGWAYHERGQDREAVGWLKQALALAPNHPQALFRMGKILASSSDEGIRNGQEALQIVGRILETQGAGNPKSPYLLDLMAMTYAEVGRYEEAQKALREALDGAKDASEKWIPEFQARLALFEAHKPYREAPPKDPSLMSAAEAASGVVPK